MGANDWAFLMQMPCKKQGLFGGLGPLLLGLGICSKAELPAAGEGGGKDHVGAESMLQQFEAAVQELRSSFLAAGPAAFRLGGKADPGLDSTECQQLWAVCCSLWV